MDRKESTVNIITSIIESTSKWSPEWNGRGFLFNMNTGKIFDVSEDGGPGHHMGFLWAITHQEELGITLSELEVFALRQVFQSDEDYSSRVEQRCRRALEIILKDHIKIVRFSGSVEVTVLELDQKTFDAMVKYLMIANDQYPIEEVFVANLDEDVPWDKPIDFEDILFLKHF